MIMNEKKIMRYFFMKVGEQVVNIRNALNKPIDDIDWEYINYRLSDIEYYCNLVLVDSE